MDPIITCAWQDESGDWALLVEQNGSDWELVAITPYGSESLPFERPDEVRRLAQALLDLPAEPEPYRFEWELSRTEPSRNQRESTHFATFTVGLAAQADHRPYLAYQSYFALDRTTSLGMQAFCEDPPVDLLRTQAHAFLTTAPGPPRARRAGS
ncbi:hypothetical protein ACFQ6N_33145 [Kitasatospora sp. NPDC056446]|uniref:hypothetical protein n=1 Tax=Kitasatospora sp. NPDC056446 TaxID=3345819 RepID=UPI0036B52BE8